MFRQRIISNCQQEDEKLPFADSRVEAFGKIKEEEEDDDDDGCGY